MCSTNHRVKDGDGLEVLGLAKPTLTALSDIGIGNVGQLWRTYVYGGGEDSMMGIGQKRGQEIRAALEKAGYFVYKPWTEHLFQDLLKDSVDRKYILTPKGEEVLIDRLLLWLASDSPNSPMWLVALRYSIGEFRWSADFKVLQKKPATEDGRYTFPTGPMRALEIAEQCDLSASEVRKALRAAKAKLDEHMDELLEIYEQYHLVLE